MKRNLLFILPMLLMCCFSVDAQEKNVTATQTNPQTDETGRWSIYWASWTEWGHGSGCGGWGLCNFSDCWFCDVADKLHGKITVEKKTKLGELVIELDPGKPDQQKAITEKSILIIETDISSEHSILYKGDYPFDSGVGKYGGYRLKVSMK
ncbi:MAG TPA: hypothetical protein VK528_00910 [Flavobacterium sp.]|nr:hypothetical protein [Flavobacterium sp.]